MFSSFAHLFCGLLNLWEISFLSSLCILIISPLSDVQLTKIFSHSVRNLFNLFSRVTDSFAVHKLCSFMQFHLSILSLNCWAIGVLLRKLLPVPIYSNVFSLLFCHSFTVSDLILRYLIYFELILVHSKRMDLVQSSTGGYLVFPAPFVEEVIFSPTHVLGYFVKIKWL
jgi:hypothetical protein